MLNMRKKALVTASGLAMVAGTSQAALQAVDPGNPAGTYTAATGFFPQWYEDTNALTLDLCLSKAVSPDPAAAGGLLCNLLPNPGVFDPALPIVFPVNFPDEAFYFTADANVVGQGIDLLYIAHLEAAFAAGLPVPGDQITFARIRIRADFDVTVPTPGTYRITHPYGVKEFFIPTPGRRVINDTADIGIGAPGDFTGALDGQIGPFLVRSATPGGAASPFIEGLDPETLLPIGEFFIGDPNVPQAVTGSPLGTNFVTIERIADGGGNPTTAPSVTANQFFLSGRVWNGLSPTNVTVDRATYSRTLDPVTFAVTTKIDGFASTPDSTTASVCFREAVDLVGGTDPCLIEMITDGAGTPPGHFFGQDPNPLNNIIPPYIVVTGTDATTTATPIARALVDVVKIGRAEYQQHSGLLILEATSSDEAIPPKLTAVGFDGQAFSFVPGTVADQRLQIDLGLGAISSEPPAFVTVVSSGGGRDTEPVHVVAVGAANQNPVAVDDTATTAEDTPVTVDVLANDTDPDGGVLTVLAIGPAVSGNAQTNVDGTVTFTPAPNYNGTGSFSYTVVDGSGGTASAQVTVTVTPVNDPPQITSQPVTGATIGQLYTYGVNAVDPEGDTLTYALDASPTGMTIDPESGLVQWTPSDAQAGNHTVTVRVTDNGATGAPPVAEPRFTTQAFTITVGAGVDYDISRFTVDRSGRTGRAGTISLRFTNAGTVQQLRTATVTGTQNGAPFYSQSQSISAAPGRTVTVSFPGFSPTVTGTINWRIEIFDDNPDVDVATATTAVNR